MYSTFSSWSLTYNRSFKVWPRSLSNLFIHLFSLIVFYENQNTDIICQSGTGGHTESPSLNRTILTAVRCFVITLLLTFVLVVSFNKWGGDKSNCGVGGGGLVSSLNRLRCINMSWCFTPIIMLDMDMDSLCQWFKFYICHCISQIVRCPPAKSITTFQSK